jgi:membrane protein
MNDMNDKETSKKAGIFEAIGSYIRTLFGDIGRLVSVVSHPSKRKLVLKNAWHFLSVLYTRITTEGVLKESASLTYITLLGFVPFVTFFLMIVPDLPFLNLKDKLQNVVAHNMLPGSAAAIMQFFDDMMTRRVVFNIISFVVLIISSLAMFTAIRNTFDRILSMRIKVSQYWLSQLVKFFGTLFFGLIIIVMLFSSSSLPIISKLIKYPLLRQLNLVLPFVTQFLGVMFLYMLLPSIRVSRRSLFRGAFWTTVVWVLAKSVFDFYIFRLTNVQAVYGVIAALPIFLMWLYLNWVIILGGIVLISVLEHKDVDLSVLQKPVNTVRLTLEMYSNDKMNQRLESIVSKKDAKKILDYIEEDLEQ